MRKSNLHKRIKAKTVYFVLLAYFVLVSWVLAQSGDNYKLQKHAINGGGTSSGGQFILTGTIGQPVVACSLGGPYELHGGFWFVGPMCYVGFDDYALFGEYWLKCGTGIPCDLDNSGCVDMKDLDRFMYEWGNPCPYAWPLK